MKAPQSFIVTPKGKRYNTGKQMGDVVFETVTSVEDAKDVSKEAIVMSVPVIYKGKIEVGDEVILHHNTFRSYYDQMGKLKYSRAHLYDDVFQVVTDELFLYKKGDKWIANENFCFIEPLRVDEDSALNQELEHTGIVFVSNEHPTGTKIGFTPESEYEVWVDGKMYYRMRDTDICLYMTE